MRRCALFLLIFSFCTLAATQAFAVSPDIRISQVYAGGASGRAWNQDYIELFNASGSTVDISSWFIAIGSGSASGLSVVAAVPIPTHVPPCSYYLIAMGPIQSSGAPVPADMSVTGTFTALTSPAGQVGIKFLNAVSGESCTFFTWHDVVGYGAATCFEGAGPAPGTAGLAASYRGAGGLNDTDNNQLDFTSNTAIPRSSLSSPNVNCLATPTGNHSWGRIKTIYR